MDHLESCDNCQRQLESESAEAVWWTRAYSELTSATVNDEFELLPACPSPSSYDILIESEDENNDAAWSDEPVLNALDQASHPELLGRLDEFDIEEKIGQGGMGVVYRGFDRSLNRAVAIKFLAPHLTTNEVARERFKREAKAAAAVVHPHVIPIFRIGSSNDHPYLAMELLSGCTLQDYVVQQGPLDVEDVMQISIQIVSGLAAAHRHELIHRDIKPANILIEPDLGRVMITDFGLARAVDEMAMTQSGCLAGTPQYMSPEQVSGGNIDNRSDLFSVGSVMYFLATGREPFTSPNAFGLISKIVGDSQPPASQINPRVPDTLNQIIERLLEKNASNRFQSAIELHELLVDYLAHLRNPQLHQVPPIENPRLVQTRLQRRRACLTGLAGTIGVIAILGMSFTSFSANRPSTDTSRDHDSIDDHDSVDEHDSVEREDHDGDHDTEHQ